MKYFNTRMAEDKKAEGESPKAEPAQSDDLGKILRRSDDKVRTLFEREREEREKTKPASDANHA